MSSRGEEWDAEVRAYQAELEARGITGDPAAEDTTEEGSNPPVDVGPFEAPLIERTDVEVQ
jgi:hypothetical protein